MPLSYSDKVVAPRGSGSDLTSLGRGSDMGGSVHDPNGTDSCVRTVLGRCGRARSAGSCLGHLEDGQRSARGTARRAQGGLGSCFGRAWHDTELTSAAHPTPPPLGRSPILDGSRLWSRGRPATRSVLQRRGPATLRRPSERAPAIATLPHPRLLRHRTPSPRLSWRCRPSPEPPEALGFCESRRLPSLSESAGFIR